MTGWVWAGIIMGLVIVALAVGIPYFLTHKTMSSPHDLSEGRAYLRDKMPPEHPSTTNDCHQRQPAN